MNKQRTRLISLIAAVSLAATLTACADSNGGANPAGTNAANQTNEANQTNDASASNGTEQSDGATAGDSGNGATADEEPGNSNGAVSEPGVTLPDTKTIELELEGMKEEQTAKLAEADGYALYIFDGFTFDAASNKLMMDYDNDYNVEIQKLASDYSPEELSAGLRQELESVGEVRELTADEIYPAMQGASLYLIASNDQLHKEYIVTEFDGSGYLLKMNVPQGEASEGFVPHAFASVNTIVND